MAKMKRQLDLLDYSGATSLEEVIQIANENNRRMQEAYLHIHNDINHKEWLYFTVGMKRWRIGPLQGYHPGKNRKGAVSFVIQELAGTDWRNQSHWGEVAGGAEHEFWGGAQDDE
jgi:hypothetical protein